VDHEVGFEAALAPAARADHGQARRRPLHTGDGGRELDLGAQLAGAFDEEADEIGIEPFQRTGTTVHDRDIRARAHGQVRELERDVAAANENDARGQGVEVEEAVARCDELLAGHAERGGARPRSDEHVAAGHPVAVHGERARAHEARAALDDVDAGLGIAVRERGWERVGFGALEANQRGPVDPEPGVQDAAARHVAGRVDGLSRAHEQLLGSAPAERAGAAHGAGVDDGDRPARIAAAACGARRGSGSHHDQIVCSFHCSSSIPSRLAQGGEKGPDARRRPRAAGEA
jgi:hypothetical protein